MISTRIESRKDGKSSAGDSLRYGQGLKVDRESGEYLDKSHRTRFGNFGLIDDAIYINPDINDMIRIIDFASVEMQSNCDLNTRADGKSKMAHFLVSFDQYQPTEAVLRDTEDSMLSAIGLDSNHFATFLHNDNGHWHLHIFASRVEKAPPHRVNSLWEDKTKRDRVCREIEIRHGLPRDNGMHEIAADGKIVEIPLAQRRAARDAKREAAPSISDKAKTAEIYSGEKTFQTWANEIRIGDRLKHAKSWKDLHAAAAAYNCEIKKKGAGLVICPVGQPGSMTLSSVGLKNLPAKFGAFEPAQVQHDIKKQHEPEKKYTPGPTEAKAQSHYQKWREARDAYQPMKTRRINDQREAHKAAKSQSVGRQQVDLKNMRASMVGQDLVAAISVAKMQHAIELAALKYQFDQERKGLRAELAAAGPGNTFRDFLRQEAKKGDDVALGLARKYGAEEANDVLRKREADELQIVAAVSGREYNPAQRMNFTYQIEPSGTVVYDFGGGRKVTDSAIAKQVQLNNAAANSPEAIATALSFATQKFGNTLTLTGSSAFQKLAVETAVLKGLNIHFKDPALQAYKQEFEASIKPRNLTLKQIQKGAQHVIDSAPGRHGPPGRPPARILARLAADGFGRVPGDSVADDIARAAIPAAATTTAKPGSLHDMPHGKLDGARQVGGGVLPDAVPGHVGDDQAGQDSDVRRAGAGQAGGRGGSAGARTNPTSAGNIGHDTDERSARTDAAAGAGTGPAAPGAGRGRGVRIAEPGERADGRRSRVPVDVDVESKKSAQRAVDAETEAAPQPSEPDPIPAHDWIKTWSAETGKLVVAARPGRGDIEYKVLHVAADGIVVDMGRAGAVYPVSAGAGIEPPHVGEKIVVNTDGEVCLPPTKETGIERGR